LPRWQPRSHSVHRAIPPCALTRARRNLRRVLRNQFPFRSEGVVMGCTRGGRTFICGVAIVMAAGILYGTRARLTAQTTGNTRFQPARLGARAATVKPRAADDSVVTVVAIL